jgi:uncharacterized protein YecE (DUF72 family)
VGREQLSLFGAAESQGVEPIVDAKATAIASRVPRFVRFGTSSWTFTGWSGIVYRGTPTHEQLVRGGLSAYARHPLFTTVGIDRGYYEPLDRDALAEYAAQLPPGFLAVSKVWNEITTLVFPAHPRFGDRAGQRNPSFLDPTVTLEKTIAPYRDAFAAHAGPFVFELPPIPRSALPPPDGLACAIDRLLSALPHDGGKDGRARYAFELRNPELLTPRYLDTLRAHGAAHVVSFWSNMPTVGRQLAIPGILTTDFVVARIMIPPGVRYEDQKAAYAPFDKIVSTELAMRRDVIALVEACARSNRALFVIVNNKAEGCSPLTIRALAETIAARSIRSSVP